jgi:hypothetical protein
MVKITMTLNEEQYEKFLKSQKMVCEKKVGRPNRKGSKYVLPEFLKNSSDYPCHYHCGICNSNLYLRHPANYIQHTKTKKHLKKIKGE